MKYSVQSIPEGGIEVVVVAADDVLKFLENNLPNFQNRMRIGEESLHPDLINALLGQLRGLRWSFPEIIRRDGALVIRRG